MSDRVTLADLSKKTGLSQSTISMVLAKRLDVSFSEDTVRLVQDAARELGYVPVSRKRVALFSRRTVVVVCPLVVNFYYSSIVQAVQSAAAEVQCNTLVYTTYRNPDEEARILKVIAESDVGGVIFAMMPQSRNLLKKISRSLPVVIIADKEDGVEAEFTELHNYVAGSLVARHLIDLGHKNIACVSTPLSSSLPARERRFDGLKDTWTELCPGGTVKLFTSFVSRIQERDNILLERELGRKITRDLLETEPDSFTAIVAINDMIAYGVLDALDTAGLSVPDDYSVCGCDNDYPSDIVGVRLTSVEHFMAQNARQAFRSLYRKMAREKQSTDLALKNIQPELVERASTGIPRKSVD